VQGKPGSRPPGCSSYSPPEIFLDFGMLESRQV
jgi:hypothetical protein